ncbi:MAG: hypothetical protein SVT52_03255 [Planctomycetota bacterium]|nr:hypothetical protein [Planctomycetota bacterium]
MTETARKQKGGESWQDGAVLLPYAARLHLRAALEQMDLLLETQQVDAGLSHLLSLLRHLRALKWSVG